MVVDGASKLVVVVAKPEHYGHAVNWHMGFVAFRLFESLHRSRDVTHRIGVNWIGIARRRRN